MALLIVSLPLLPWYPASLQLDLQRYLGFYDALRIVFIESPANIKTWIRRLGDLSYYIVEEIGGLLKVDVKVG